MVIIGQMPISRERLDKYLNRNMRQIEHASKIWDVRATKSKNNYLRQRWLERQTNANYRNEYDRLQSEIAHGKVQTWSIPILKKRTEDLHKLFSLGNV
jgi:hypothetical protein